MILSFHPCIDADIQVILGDKKPDNTTLGLIQQASAVILAQGCPPELYQLASSNCPNVFPNYDLRYKYPGKVGQARLFEDYGVIYPHTHIWRSTQEFRQHLKRKGTPHRIPFVMKADQGHEGEHVYIVKDDRSLAGALSDLEAVERPGYPGFITQDYIDSGRRVLRVVVIGKRLLSYWKLSEDPDDLVVSLSKGARIEPELWQGQQSTGRKAVREFCRHSGINLAAIDLIFSSEEQEGHPLFLEINYYFGRRGLGGSDEYYKMLFEEVKNWLHERDLDCSRVALTLD